MHETIVMVLIHFSYKYRKILYNFDKKLHYSDIEDMILNMNNSDIVNGRRMGLNGVSIPDTDYFVSNYIRIKSNTNYAVNYEMSVYSRMAFYDKNKVFISDNSSNANFKYFA